MGIFEETVVKAKEIADLTGKKAGEIINIQKMRVSAATLNSQISKLYEVLGRLAYEAAKNGADTAAQSAQTIAEIDEKREELSELKAKIAEARGKRVCHACRADNSADALFCDKCGQKLTIVVEPEVVDVADDPTDEV